MVLHNTLPTLRRLTIAVLAVAQMLHGATFGAYHAASIGAINRWFPGRLQARGQALYGSISFGAGGMLGGLLSGYTWDAIGPAWTYTIASLFALMGLWVVWRGWPASPNGGRNEETLDA